MKALSIKQPWASLIVAGIKDIENRTWKTNFRGRIYVHASAKPDPLKFNALTKTQRFDAETSPNSFDPLYFDDLPVSSIIGEVDIVDCVINHSSIWAEKASFPSNSKPIYNWVLANSIRYEKPIPAKGKLSFWEPDIFITECIGCDGKFDLDTMEQDDADENYCLECWAELSPIMKAEYDELVKNGEIDPLEENGFSFETGV